MSSISEALETSLYNQLAEIDVGRTACAITRQRSLLSQRDASDAVLARVNERLPYLSDLKKRINQLVGENQLLSGKIGSRQAPMYGSHSEAKLRLIAEYDKRNEDVKELMAEYERVMAELPGSDLPSVRNMIEDRFEGKFSALRPFSEREFASLGELALSKLEEAHRKMLKRNTPPSSHYALDFDEKTRLASDPDLIAELLRRDPSVQPAIERFQCLANQRTKGHQLAMAGTLLLPAGSFALMKAAQTTYAMRSIGVARSLANGSRALGWAAVGVGGAQGISEVYGRCFKAESASGNSDCSVSLKSVVQEHTAFDCVAGVLIAGTNVIGGVAGSRLGATLARTFEGKSKAVNDFIAKSRLRGAQGRDLAGASQLDDTQRIVAARALLGRKLSPEQEAAILKAHEVGPGFGRYSEEDIFAKDDILIKAGFGIRERKILLGKGITGKDAPAAFDFAGVAKKVEAAKAGLPKGGEIAELEARIKPMADRIAEIDRDLAVKIEKMKELKSGASTAKKQEDLSKLTKEAEDLRGERWGLSAVKTELETEHRFYSIQRALSKQESQKAKFSVRAEELGYARRALGKIDDTVEHAVERAGSQSEALASAVDLLRKARQTGMNVEGAMEKAARLFGKRFAATKAGPGDPAARQAAAASAERTATERFYEDAIKMLKSTEGMTPKSGYELDWILYQEQSDARLAQEMVQAMKGSFSGNPKDLARWLERIRERARADGTNLDQYDEMVRGGGASVRNAPVEFRGLDVKFGVAR